MSPDYPVVVPKFEVRAREVEVDAVADQGEIVLWALSEHIEDARVHSGDATLVLPPQTLYIGDLKLAAATVEALRSKRPHEVGIVAWGDYMQRRPLPLNELSGLPRRTR